MLAWCLVASTVLSAGAEGRAGQAPKTIEGRTFQTVVQAGRNPLVLQADYTLWVPAGAGPIKCVIAINRRGVGPKVFADPQWRAMAKRIGGAMMYCGFEAKGVIDNGGGRSMLRALAVLALQAKRPEVAHAPLVLWGHSMGGRVAQDFTRWKPARVLAFVIGMRAYASDAAFMAEPKAAMAVPCLYVMGALDNKPADIREHFERSRAAAAPRAWVWLPGQKHSPDRWDRRKRTCPDKAWRSWVAHDLVIPWIEAMVALRLPPKADTTKGPVRLLDPDTTKGWLGDVKSHRIAPQASFKGDKSKAAWLPNEAVARKWQAVINGPAASKQTTPAEAK